jgi:hypothetical protein
VTIHATNITIHGCKVHLEPTGPEPSDAEQRLRHEVGVVSGADSCLRGILSGMTAVAKPPRRCQRCDSVVEGRAFVIVGGGVMHHECFREAMTTAKATRFITTASLPSGQVEIAANSEAARAEARAIIEGHKANLDRIAELEDELARAKADHGNACGLVARMHAAAVGSIRGPIRGVVEDVEDLAKRCRSAEARLANASTFAVDEIRQHNDTESKLHAAREEVRRLTEERTKLMTERDEARQMHRERVFYDRHHLTQQLDELHARWIKLRIAVDGVMAAACPVPGWIVDRLKKALS